jgi:hypothetical protein
VEVEVSHSQPQPATALVRWIVNVTGGNWLPSLEASSLDSGSDIPRGQVLRLDGRRKAVYLGRERSAL